MSKQISYTVLEQAYKELHNQYNAMAKEHNTLVDKHDALINDARSLLLFIEDLTKGMKAYVRKGIQLGHVDPCEHVSIPSNLRIEEGRVVMADLHNVIADFLLDIKNGTPVSEAYTKWQELCKTAKENNNNTGGILLS